MKKALLPFLLFPGLAVAQTLPSPTVNALTANTINLTGVTNTQVLYEKAGALTGNSGLLFYDTAIAQPSAPTLTTSGTPGSTTYYYTVTPLFGLGQGISSAPNSIATGNTTLSGSNFIQVATAAVTNSTSCDVFGERATRDGLWRYVGNVACGSTINDTGATATTNNTTGGNQVDASAGESVVGSLKVGNFLSIGGKPPGYNYLATSGQTPLTIDQTVTGGATNPVADPIGVAINLNVNPAANGSVAQPWGIIDNVTVLAASTHNIPALEGQSISVTHNGSGTLDSGDGLVVSFTLGSGVTNPNGDVDTSVLNGVKSTVVVNNQAVGVVGLLGSVVALGSAGTTVTQMDNFRAYYISGSTGQTVTRLNSFNAETPFSGTNVVNYEAFHSDDSHTIGGTTSYGVHIKGTSFKNLFEGPVSAGSVISTGTRFTASGCGASPVAGSGFVGTFTVTTTGSCTATVTIGASQPAAPAGWSCWVSNQTTANLIRQTASNTTTATFVGVTVNGDTISFGCIGY